MPEVDLLRAEVFRLGGMLDAALLQNSEMRKLFARWAVSELSDMAFAALMSGVIAGTEKPFQGPQILLPDGAAPPDLTLPSFTSDPNTGRYRDASGEIQFVKDGVVQKRVEQALKLAPGFCRCTCHVGGSGAATACGCCSYNV